MSDSARGILEQIREYSAFKIRCQMELGERTARMEKGSGGDRKSSDFKSYYEETFENTKKSQLSDIGLTRKQAWQNEQLIKPENKPIVEQYIKEREELKEAPTLSGALKEIKAATKPHVVNNSGDNEWYTPAEYIEAQVPRHGRSNLKSSTNWKNSGGNLRLRLSWLNADSGN